MGANVKLETIMQFSDHGANAGCKCRCGHVGTIDAPSLVRWAFKRGGPWHVSAITRHLRCTSCGTVGHCRIGLSYNEPSTRWRLPLDT